LLLKPVPHLYHHSKTVPRRKGCSKNWGREGKEEDLIEGKFDICQGTLKRTDKCTQAVKNTPHIIP
jgi:hypothetical protein